MVRLLLGGVADFRAALRVLQVREDGSKRVKPASPRPRYSLGWGGSGIERASESELRRTPSTRRRVFYSTRQPLICIHCANLRSKLLRQRHSFIRSPSRSLARCLTSSRSHCLLRQTMRWDGRMDGWERQRERQRDEGGAHLKRARRFTGGIAYRPPTRAAHSLARGS